MVVVLFVVALAGGGWVFRARTQWAAVVVAIVLASSIPWSIIATTMSAMGAMKPDGVGGSCVGHQHDCDAFAYVAGLIVAVSPFCLGALFAGAFAVKRRRYSVPTT
jgi:hypothetical protein